jgi:hypothetical protein
VGSHPKFYDDAAVQAIFEEFESGRFNVAVWMKGFDKALTLEDRLKLFLALEELPAIREV